MKGLELPRIKTSVPGPKSQELSKRLKKVECPNITFIAEDYPIFVERSYLANVWDADGNRFVDLTSFFGVSLLGHRHPVVLKCLKDNKIINGMGDVLPSSSKVRLLEKLSQLLGGGFLGILGQNGSDAVEAAIKTSFLYTGKKRIIAFEGAYHGLSFGSLLCTFNSKFKSPFSSLLIDVTTYFPFPEENNWMEIAEKIEEFISKSEDVGLLIIEPVQARGGVRIVPAGFVTKIREITKRHGVLLAFDEIFSGLGRCGRMFAFEYYGVIPDIITLGKALSSSFPLSVMMAREEIMKAWPLSQGEAIHTSTFLGHPLICEIGYNVLRYIEENRIPEEARLKGETLLTKLSALRNKFPGLIRDVRGLGLLIGVEFQGVSAFELSKKLLNLGYITLSSGLNGEVLELTPPVVITGEIIEDFTDKFTWILRKWTSLI
ncbi:MAG: aspartate aminotransferase family protein [candidate division WOR-3 bacterium]